MATVGVQTYGGLVVVTDTRTQQRGDERLGKGGGGVPENTTGLPRRSLALIKPITPPPSETLMDDL